MRERIGADLEVEAVKSGLEARIQDETLLPFKRDREFVRELLRRLDRLLKRLDQKEMLVALDQLVPRRNADGTRQIADRRISPKLEETIASRYRAEEIDLVGPEGVWGSLPQAVRIKKQELGDFGLSLEMTDRCTVMCDFCGIAEKGKVTRKASFASVIKITADMFGDTVDFGEVSGIIPSDAYYWGSDPFDARWYNEATGIDLDYGDVLIKHQEICGTGRYVYTSTALPIGEELRVLRTLLWFLKARNRGDISPHSTFRISRTKVNQERSEHLATVARTFYGADLEKSGVLLSRNRNEYPYLAGKNAVSAKVSTTDDITGVNCKDMLLVSVSGLDYVTMAGTSSERPSGETRRPARVERADGSVEYCLPRYYYIPDLDKDEPGGYYPNVELHRVRVKGNGETTVRVETLKKDPYRAHVRLAARAGHFFAKNGSKKWEERRLSRVRKLKLTFLVKDDLELVRKHLERTGISNPMMEGTCLLWEYILGK